MPVLDLGGADVGFGEKICGELGEDRDGMLKRIYEYVRKMQK